ncbi:hydantoinase/oxoprolinase family protein [Acuticoccus mangrovi]|uniref:Hydantoinase/oxoprolinase family protein n=1 Tax=Acuticoccus mangrovi TaxID=2796142 RepID=A0A934ISE3_9HYPH|nr:hydantoinase/oxoprolinase family protein [Acuticoccus mangrovi]MBJ3776799.1 hydantoinase/oxoprolinase family protein [Acuticoccus mangrovi]
MTKTKLRFRIGVDVGGTFTDLVLSDSQTGRLVFFKEPSTPSDPSEAVEKGILGLLDRAGLQPADVDLIVHGTTIGLNAIIQRRGAPLALVVSKGNRDIFEIGRGKVPDAFDLRSTKEDSLVPRELVFELPARTLYDGTIEERPAPEDYDRLVAALKASGVSAVAVTFLNSYLHPELEAEVAQTIRERLPGVLVTASAAIWPEIREFERALVASLNAYINPLMGAYFDRLEERLAGNGITAQLLLTTNNGGTLGLDTVRARPIETVLSGPSAGVVSSARLAELAETKNIITFDMGGTSSDMAVSVGGKPELATYTTVGDFPLMLPVVNVSAIGAGGGSIIWVDGQGVLKVGPVSAGAQPGPICYRRGGTEPTVTDCYLVTGMLAEDGFLGGRMKLDRESAQKALDALAEKIGLTGPDRACLLAEAALQIATAKMATELLKTCAKRGLNPREFTLIAYGGAGPTHANFLAEEIGLSAVLVPPSPGTLCAFGALMTDFKRDYVRTIRRRVDGADGEVARLIPDLAESLRVQAAEWLEQESDIAGEIVTSWTADLRYAGEGHELTVELEGAAIEPGGMETIRESYHAKHMAIYGFQELESEIDVISLRSQVVGKMPEIVLPVVAPRGAGKPPTETRRVFSRGAWIEAAVVARGDLFAGDVVHGPALVTQEDTTTWILSGWKGTMDSSGIITVTRS